MYAITVSKSKKKIHINNNPMVFYSKLTKNKKMISQLCYKHKSQTLNIDTNSQSKINNVNNRIDNFTIKLLY